MRENNDNNNNKHNTYNRINIEISLGNRQQNAALAS